MLIIKKAHTLGTVELYTGVKITPKYCVEHTKYTPRPKY